MDLFANDAGDISSGNMRSRANEQMNAAVGLHNQAIARNIADIHQKMQDSASNFKRGQSQASEAETLGAISQSVEGLIGAHKFSSALSHYKQARASASGLTKTEALSKTIRQAPEGTDGEVRVGTGDGARPTVEPAPNTTPDPATSATPEGSSATGSDPAPTNEEHTAITVGKDGDGEAGSMLHKGFKNLTGMSDEGIEKLGKGAGVIGAGVTGGLDLFKDIKAGKIAGANGWEQAGNVAQIGGAIADIAGAVPVLAPLEIIGGALDLLGGGLDAIGEFVEGSKKKKEASAAQQKQQAQAKAQQATLQSQKESLGAVVGSAPVAVARVQ